MIDCNHYENCPKAITTDLVEFDKNVINFIFFGCWGTYCYDGKFNDIKFKYDEEKGKGKLKKEDGFYVGKSAVDIMQKYSNKKEIEAVIIGGDNIYQTHNGDSLSKELDDLLDTLNKELKSIHDDSNKIKYFENFKKKNTYDLLNNMDLQLKEGFEECILGIRANKYLVGIGNHDIVTCNILNKQINYDKWTMPGLYYNYRYKLLDGTIINLIFIDTNLYTEDPYCNSEEKYLQKNAIETQYEWLKNILSDNENNYNIIIGHQPFSTNPHKYKPKMSDGTEKIYPKTLGELRDHLLKQQHLIDLYLCADEHNQQYIIDNEINEVISGTGGAQLDTNIFHFDEKIAKEKFSMETKFTAVGPGFVGVDIDSKKIKLSLITKNNKDISETTAYYDILRRRF
jgi:hypothetical protein